MLTERQFQIDREIAQAVRAQVPPSWSAARLRAERQVMSGGREGYRMTLDSPEGAGEILIPGEPVELALRKLFLLHKELSTGMRVATYLFKKRGDGGWSWTAEYEYED